MARGDAGEGLALDAGLVDPMLRVSSASVVGAHNVRRDALPLIRWQHAIAMKPHRAIALRTGSSFGPFVDALRITSHQLTSQPLRHVRRIERIASLARLPRPGAVVMGPASLGMLLADPHLVAEADLRRFRQMGQDC